MNVHVSSDGMPSSTRVVLIDDTGHRIDLTRMVRAVTWHLDESGRGARAVVQLEGAMSAELKGELGLITEAPLSEDEIRAALMEVPG